MGNSLFTTETLQNFDRVHSLEWLETNGLGGYASGTVSGAHSRRYHGLLVASMQPPVARTVILSKLDETIVVGDQRYELGTNQYPGVLHPHGYSFLISFERNLFPEFQYQAGSVKLKKTIAAIQGENTTVILYEVLEAAEKFSMELLPLYSCRDFHSLSHANDAIGQQYLFDNGAFRTMNYHGCPELFITVPGSQFTESKAWYHNIEFAQEQQRGLDFQEDLFTHGKFTVALKKGETLGIIISTDDPGKRDAFKLFKAETKRREEITAPFSWNENIKRLALAADQFIVKRGNLNTIIAGYHWFSDWGRDTMISLPGLCLTTGRYKDAKNILQVFADSVSEGMLPNRFPDQGDIPEYNTIDATLWFFQAIYQHHQKTGDKKFVKSMLPVLADIIAWHEKGTRYNIHIDPTDGLLYGGQEGVQLTWMDAKVGDWVVTPRTGKAVEINALWYNALRIMEVLIQDAGGKTGTIGYRDKADKVHASFNDQFWNEKGKYLYDFVNGEYKNDDLRPNQLIAVSLPFALLNKERAKKVLDTCGKYLLTPKGLRSVAPSHKDFKPVYCGNIWDRDGCYHQGTVWSFLLGPYVESLIKVKEEKGRTEATKILTAFFQHLDEACVGSVSEIFDGDPPHTPRGCVAQAWGVAEVLRVAVDYALFSDNKLKV